MINSRLSTVLLAALLSTVVIGQDRRNDSAREKTQPGPASSINKPAEDISGMYSFLSDGEFVQINLEENGVSGYISRRGDLDSDRGAFLDQFFSKATVQGHYVGFTTKSLHGVWFEFRGRFERGPAKTKSQDGYYILRGTLTEFTADANNTPKSRSREVEFKLLGQPQDDADPEKPATRQKVEK
jgi:hypothetical protein